MTTTVDHLKKVSLELQIGSRTEPFDFICGAASEGFCPFEYELLHKEAGDQLSLSVPQTRAVQTFAHLYKPLRMALKISDPMATLDFKISIISVCDPEPREVIQAMAQATDQNGCGGDCGCGCGGH